MFRAKDFVQAAGISKTFDLNKKMKSVIRGYVNQLLFALFIITAGRRRFW